ncbi:MAG TPA: histidine kinase [Gaiellales bacterium]|jgi:signal transduction histidine kinase
MRRTTGQSERKVWRHAQTALAVLVLVLAGLFGFGLWAVVRNKLDDEWLAVLIVLGSAGVATGAWLLARIPAEMRSLAGERRRALDDLLRAEEVERERIATELHEDTIQAITAALVTIDRMTPAVRAGDTARVAEALPPARAMLAGAAERVRRLTHELHPPLLDVHGLPVALTDLIDRAARDAGLETDVVVEVGRYPFVVEELAYRVVREAIADARAHAGTSRIEVDIREHRGAVHGRVWDNGSKEPARRADDRPRALLHLSLEQLAERVRLADGDLTIRSIPARGTLVAFRLPLSARADADEDVRVAASAAR